MTRTLPWKRSEGSSSRSSSIVRRHVSGTGAPRARKERPAASPSDIEDTNGHGIPSPKPAKSRIREPSTSPPPTSSQPEVQEGPEEIFMRDGLDHDDRYRMVEDEFLDIAKRFTRHLHAAEYQRMKREARSQNSATINSISRPVTMKMPDHTRRKVEGVTRARKQVKTLRGLLGKRSRGVSSDEDEDEDGGGAWAGTALYGLMGSPQKSAASLVKVGGQVIPMTRAAAGFKRYHAPRRRAHVSSSPPEPEEADISKLDSTHHDDAEETSDDDDLDALTASRGFPPPDGETRTSGYSDDPQRRPSRPAPNFERTRFNPQTTIPEPQLPPMPPPKGPDPEILDYRPSAESMARIARRREQARLQQEKITKERPKKETDLDVIPTFL